MNKDELKQAYKLLGLPENASREEVERVADVLLRQSRSRNISAQDKAQNERKLEAYKLIVQAEKQGKIAEMSRERFRKWGKLAGPAEKMDDFFRLYKHYVIIGLVVIAALIYGTTAYLDHREEQKRLAALPPIDLSILMIGNYMADEAAGGTPALEQAMTAQIPEFQRLELELVYLPLQGEAGSADIAYQQKAMAVVATSSPDIYITDKASFDWLGGGGAFYNLDEDAAGELQPLLTEDNMVKAISEDDGAEHLYGIDISDSTLLDELPLSGSEVIVSLRADIQNKDKALHMIKKYLESIPKAAE
ncbi:hypothetical protein [Paenibacillus sanguinis]|uniref:hypothetical protein n=1 Tax=Paenibacillus sanguinis TaxID=225906 RepID=UPI0003647A9C|nr:hypothetical protein [Paenibacillus sanguinis]